ncbi:MAG: hypothetical protein ACI30V_05710 [Muribaculaceae bacterium]
MQPVELLSLSDTETYSNLLIRYAKVRNSYKIRSRHYQLDTERGFKRMAASRVDKLNAAAAEVEQLTPQVKEIVEKVEANLALDPKNKCARLLRLYLDVIAADIFDVADINRRITSLRGQIFKSSKAVKKPAKTAKSAAPQPATDAAQPSQPTELSLF